MHKRIAEKKSEKENAFAVSFLVGVPDKGGRLLKRGRKTFPFSVGIRDFLFPPLRINGSVAVYAETFTRDLSWEVKIERRFTEFNEMEMGSSFRVILE